MTFFNDKTNNWTIATLTSGAIKYYKKQGPYHNFADEKNARGGHYFYPGGLWSILTDDRYQLPPQSDSSDEEIISLGSQFIDDDYDDQLELTMTPPLLEHQVNYPSAATFPDLDTEIPYTSPFRDRAYSYSDPEITQTGCGSSIQTRWNRLTAAVRAWSTGDINKVSTNQDNSGEETGGEREEGSDTDLI